jgi:23S rRNA (uracil1939-C5)-methyltransferase
MTNAEPAASAIVQLATHQPSADTPLECEHADRCAGCPLMGKPYGDQLADKQARVVRALAPYRELTAVVVAETAGAESTSRYRPRAKLMIAPGPRVGLYARDRDHEVVDIPGCRVLRPAILDFVASLRKLLADPPQEAGASLLPYQEHAAPGNGSLAAVDVREVLEKGPGQEGAQLLVTFVLVVREQPPQRAELQAAARAIAALSDAVTGVAVNFRKQGSPQVLGAETHPLWGVLSTPDSLRGGACYQLATFGAFVQAHRDQAARIVDSLVAEIVAPHATTESARTEKAPRVPRVLDLYAGSGALGLPLAAAGARMVLVESFAPAARDAERAAEAQGLTGVEVIAADAAAAVRRLVERGVPFDAVVVDPPRRGLAPDVRRGLVALAPSVVAYVSCDPESLARDLAHLAHLGYAACAIAPFDMMPQTDQVEAVAFLYPAEPAPRPVLHADADLTVVEKEPFSSCAGNGVTSQVELAEDESGICVQTRVRADAPAAAGGAEVRTVLSVMARGILRAQGNLRLHRARGRTSPARHAPKTEARYRRGAVVAGHSLLEITVTSVTGGSVSPMWIRRALAALGHPVLGDDRFGHPATNRHFSERYLLDRPFLHCKKVEMVHPRTQERLAWESPLSGDLRAVLSRMQCADAQRGSGLPNRDPVATLGRE